MSKILQIRRGSTAENDKFTGLVGEITMDTDNKTIRIHDGQTVGGFELARADQVGEGGGGSTEPQPPFDINDVSDEFWTELFQKFEKPQTQIQMQETPLLLVKNQPCLDYQFSSPTDFLFVRASLVCQTAEAGYSPNEEVMAWGIGSRANPAPNVFTSSSGVTIRLMIGSESYWVSNKSTGKTTNITNENWRIKFRLYY